MSWKDEIKKGEDENMMSAKADATGEDIVNALSDLSRDIENMLNIGKVVRALNIEDVIRLFDRHYIKLTTQDVLRFLGN
jgi:hypothetical protein|tara:strand:+ start:70 stop:306 length:237 start_codon:yes stop_codon:yes gene_type:complete